VITHTKCYDEWLGLGSSAFRYDARPGGSVADPPEDLEYGVVVFEVLRVDRCLEARLLAVNMCGGVYGSFSLYIIVDTYYIKGRNSARKDEAIESLLLCALSGFQTRNL